MRDIFKTLIFLFAVSSIAPCVSAEDCTKLSKAECAHSKRCIIDCEMKERAGSLKCDGRYFCREPKGECEINWKPDYSEKGGRDSLRNDCEKTAGCHFDDHDCVCPCDFHLPSEPQCMCACGGGSPPTCRY